MISESDMKNWREVTENATPEPWSSSAFIKFFPRLALKDADFIAVARTAMPLLIAEVRRLYAAMSCSLCGSSVLGATHWRECHGIDNVDRKPLYAEHGTLAEKLLDGTITPAEVDRLAYVRMQLDLNEMAQKNDWLRGEVDRLTAELARADAGREALRNHGSVLLKQLKASESYVLTRPNAAEQVEALRELIMSAAPVTWTAGACDAAYEWEKRAHELLKETA